LRRLTAAFERLTEGGKMKYRTIIGSAVVLAFSGVMVSGAQAGKDTMKMDKDKMMKMEMKIPTSISKSLSDKPGDAENGKKVVIDRKKGNCLACHAISDLKDQPDHGDVGPPLDDVGSRLKADEIRAQIADPKGSNPDTIMPAFYKKDGFHRLQKKWIGKTIIGAQDVEDVIAYLLTLKGSYSK